MWKSQNIALLDQSNYLYHFAIGTLNLWTLWAGGHIFMQVNSLNDPEQDHSVRYWKTRKRGKNWQEIEMKSLWEDKGDGDF
jgi:hypothetical protein